MHAVVPKSKQSDFVYMFYLCGIVVSEKGYVASPSQSGTHGYPPASVSPGFDFWGSLSLPSVAFLWHQRWSWIPDSLPSSSQTLGLEAFATIVSGCSAELKTQGLDMLGKEVLDLSEIHSQSYFVYF